MKARSKATKPAMSIFSLVLTLSLLVANISQGQTLTGGEPQASNTPTLRYLGTVDDEMLFQLQFYNAPGNKFRVFILDAEGDELYGGSFSDKNFDKKFQLPKSYKDKIVFRISEATGKQLHQFEVNTKMVEEVQVRRVVVKL
jgi:hypothetical protein